MFLQQNTPLKDKQSFLIRPRQSWFEFAKNTNVQGGTEWVNDGFKAVLWGTQYNRESKDVQKTYTSAWSSFIAQIYCLYEKQPNVKFYVLPQSQNT